MTASIDGGPESVSPPAAGAEEQEAEIWIGSPQPRSLLPAILGLLIITLVLIAVSRIASLQTGSQVARYGAELILLLSWLFLCRHIVRNSLACEYHLTNRRLFYRRGFGHPGRPPLTLTTFSDARAERTRFERWSGVGRVVLLGANGARICTLVGLVDPEHVAGLIRKQIRKAKEQAE
jgi:hypothetical protein